MLNFPPAGSVWHLPMGIAYLAGILESAGHEVWQRYGHIAGTEFLLRRHGGEEADRALQIVHDANASVIERYRARRTFETVSRSIPTSDTFVVERNNVRYDSSTFKGRPDELLRVLDAGEEQLFHEYFVEEELAFARRHRPHLYGISIADERQLVPGCLLAALVKEALPETLVVVGGNYWTRVRGALAAPGVRELLTRWDAVVCTEGFEPIVELAAGTPPSQVAGVAWWDGGTVRRNPAAHTPASYEDLPTPVFDRETRQWSPDFVAPLYTMSNCPMRCSFCSISGGSDTYLAKPRSMTEATIARHMAAIGTDRFDIQDEYLSIPRQLRLGEELRRIGHRATWHCYLTASDRLLDPAVAERLYEAGCRGVQLGLESLDPEVLAQESKVWNHPRNYGRILANLAAAGIQVHVFIIVGCPNEPVHWSVQWLAFLERFGEHILTIKPTRYRLTRRAPDERMARLDQLPGLRLTGADELPLNLNHDQFAYTSHGLSHKRVDAVRDLLEEACRRHWAYQVTSTIPWWINRGRYTLAELRRMAGELEAGVPPEPGIDDRHLKRALGKVSSALREAGVPASLATYDHALRQSRRLLAGSLADAVPARAAG